LLEAVEALRIGERETLLYLLLSLHKGKRRKIDPLFVPG